MKLIFAGTPEFAARALDALIAAGHDIALVLTQPDRPAGRGMKLAMSPVKELALRHGLRVEQPLNLKTEESCHPIAEARADCMIVAAYGLILPQSVLDMPRLGCVNIHASLLPRWRGAAPIQRAIEAGDSETGITLMQMDAGLDTGAMLRRATLPIQPTDTGASLHDRLAVIGAREIVALLPSLETTRSEPQDHNQATYAAKLKKEEGLLDWNQPADLLARRIRAFNPFPGCYTFLDGQPLKIWQAEQLDGSSSPGQISQTGRDTFSVGCGQGLLRVHEVQKAGGKRLSAEAFLSGHPLDKGAFLSSPPSSGLGTR
jgi:methionyl-tRNA formyltransferase